MASMTDSSHRISLEEFVKANILFNGLSQHESDKRCEWGSAVQVLQQRIKLRDYMRGCGDYYLKVIAECLYIRSCLGLDQEPVNDGELGFKEAEYTLATISNIVSTAVDNEELTWRESAALIWDSFPEEIQVWMMQENLEFFGSCLADRMDKVKFLSWVSKMRRRVTVLYTNYPALCSALARPAQLRYLLGQTDRCRGSKAKFTMYALSLIRNQRQTLSAMSNNPWDPHGWGVIAQSYQKSVAYLGQWAHDACEQGALSLDDLKALIPACMRGWPKFEVVKALVDVTTVDAMLNTLESFRWGHWFNESWQKFSEFLIEDASHTIKGGRPKSSAWDCARFNALRVMNVLCPRRLESTGCYFENLHIGELWSFPVEGKNPVPNLLAQMSADLELAESMGMISRQDRVSLLYRFAPPGTISTQYLRGSDDGGDDIDALINEVLATDGKSWSDFYIFVRNAAKRADARYFEAATKIYSNHLSWNLDMLAGINSTVQRELIPLCFTSLERLGYQRLGWRDPKFLGSLQSPPSYTELAVFDVRRLAARA
jgi:hypothetical protein